MDEVFGHSELVSLSRSNIDRVKLALCACLGTCTGDATCPEVLVALGEVVLAIEEAAQLKVVRRVEVDGGQSRN